MILRQILLLLLGILGNEAVCADIIPRPSQLEKLPGEFTFPSQMSIASSPDLENEVDFLRHLLSETYGIKLIEGTATPHIALRVDADLAGTLGDEGYVLDISTDQLSIRATHPRGIFYGIQSLRQLLGTPTATTGTFTLPCLRINDRPRFSWRACMLDEARHFKGKSTVKKLLDEMALLKMNTFHWHLTDDQGWRIEIKKYPLLTAIGGHRDSTMVDGWGTDKFIYDGKPHAGFYTQDDIREIVEYAAARHITIIPEIDMPGHTSAAIAAYPWLGSGPEPITVPGYWGVLDHALNVSDPKVISFVHDVLEEVMALFPSDIIHIGGDEVKYDEWKSSAAIRQLMAEKGLRSPADVQTWFTNELSRFLTSKGRRMMGWNDVLGEKILDHFNNDETDYVVSDRLAASTLVHFWMGDERLMVQAAEEGHDIVNAFHEYTYFNYDYEGIPLAKAYSFDPLPGKLREMPERVLGVSCQLWSEFVPTEKRLDYLLFPRIAATAEVGWTQIDRKDFAAFQQALEGLKSHWTKIGIQFNQSKY